MSLMLSCVDLCVEPRGIELIVQEAEFYISQSYHLYRLTPGSVLGSSSGKSCRTMFTFLMIRQPKLWPINMIGLSEHYNRSIDQKG